MKFGLSDAQIKDICTVLEKHPAITEAVVFGSRAMGNFKEASDVDLAIKGKVNAGLAATVKDELEETDLPFFFDVVAYPAIGSPKLNDHIEKHGEAIYLVGWRTCVLQKVADVQTGPFGSQLHQSDYQSVGTPIITVEHLGNNRILHENLPLVSDTDKERLARYTLRTGDIVFSRVGSVDRCAFVSGRENGWMFSGRLLRVRAKENEVDPRYLSFYFCQEDFKETIRMIAVGATMPSINTEILSTVEVLLPPLPTQRAIAGVLSCLDDKIDLLRRQNKTLEGLAEALWRKKFVEEADPKWKLGKIENLGQVICGKTPSTKIGHYFGGRVPFVKIPDMHGKVFITETVDYLTEEGRDSQAAKTIPAKSICVSCIATVGLVCLNETESQTNQQINTIVPLKDNLRYYTFLLLRSMKDDLLTRASGGTATDNLNTGDFSRIEVTIPPDAVLNEFQMEVDGLFVKLLANQQQMEKLANCRDSLLPKLLSGEISVHS